MIRLISLALAILPLCATHLAAQQAFDCDWPARADSIVEPWVDNTRTFANGNVRLAALDTIEPAAGAYHVLILSPPYDELGGRQCRVLSLGEGVGFAGLDFPTLKASYDPAVGLVFSIDVSLYDGDMGTSFPKRLQFSLNQSTGEIGAYWP